MYNENTLYGTWVGKKGDIEITAKFNKDSTCEITYNSVDSNVFKINGNIEVDFSKKPIPLTIIKIPQLSHNLHTIIQFKELDVMRMAKFAPRNRLRPITFNPDTEIIFRKRNIAQ